MTDDGNGRTTDGESSETRALSVSRVVEAPPERVYEAFLDPDELSEWMHPPGAACEVHHLEPETGGTYRITMLGERPDGTEYGHTYGGPFEELVPGERIVQTEVAESDESAAEVTLTVTFAAVPDGTEVTVTMEIPVEWPDDGIAGWEAALGNLAALLGGE